MGRKTKPKQASSPDSKEEAIDDLFEQTKTDNPFLTLPPELTGKIGVLSSTPDLMVISYDFLAGFEYQIPSMLAATKEIVGEERVKNVLKSLLPKASSKEQLRALILDQRQRAKDIYGGSEFIKKITSEKKSFVSESVVNEIEMWIQAKQDESLVQFAETMFMYPKFKELENLDAAGVRKWLKENQAELPKIKKLVISNPKLFSCLPSEIGMFTDLKELKIDGTNLKTLPPEIKNLKELESLQISNSPNISLPFYLADLPKIRILQLDANNLETFPQVIFELHGLTALNLNQNQLAAIPKDLEKLKNLNTLFLSDNSIKNVASYHFQHGKFNVFGFVK